MIVAVSILYLATAALAFRAALVARRLPGTAARSSARWWLAIGCFFAGLAAWRLTGAEESIRSAVRGVIVARGQYGLRHAVQQPLAAVALLALTGLAAWGALALRTLRPRLERTLFWAKTGALAMAGLVAVRLISFHATDVLLYTGPHLNRVMDPALTLFVGIQAALFVRHARRAHSR